MSALWYRNSNFGDACYRAVEHFQLEFPLDTSSMVGIAESPLPDVRELDCAALWTHYSLDFFARSFPTGYVGRKGDGGLLDRVVSAFDLAVAKGVPSSYRFLTYDYGENSDPFSTYQHAILVATDYRLIETDPRNRLPIELSDACEFDFGRKSFLDICESRANLFVKAQGEFHAMLDQLETYANARPELIKFESRLLPCGKLPYFLPPNLLSFKTPENALCMVESLHIDPDAALSGPVGVIPNEDSSTMRIASQNFDLLWRTGSPRTYRYDPSTIKNRIMRYATNFSLFLPEE